MLAIRRPMCLAGILVTMMSASWGLGTTLEREMDRACWKDEDCKLYPLCRTRALACRCQTKGSCLLARGFQQPCLVHDNCAVGLTCGSGNFCQCSEGDRFSKFYQKCISEPNDKEPPRFADLPDEEDPDAPPEIPATYGGPLLVGVIGLGLVVLCLGMALWCRCTAPRTPPNMSPARCPHVGHDKIPMDLFYLPPPEKYQTPGYNYSNYSQTRGAGERAMPSTSNNYCN